MINVISHLWKSLNKNKLPTNQEKQTVPKEKYKSAESTQINFFKKNIEYFLHLTIW